MSRSRLAWTAVACSVVLGLAGYPLYVSTHPRHSGPGCRVVTPRGSMVIDTEQAANSSTIAAVAFRKRLPAGAVTIAFATALQESRLRNLSEGDRDSVGLFQQRPSQGWGVPQRLQDPIYAANRFFDALIKVDDYLDRPLADAAQTVQRSADGRAYARHEPRAEMLTDAFTGRARAAVGCWYAPARGGGTRGAEAVRELRRAFGPLRVDGLTVMEPSSRAGWAVAIWAVTHAREYGLTRLDHDGRHWEAGGGRAGWTPDPRAPSDRVTLS